MPTKTTSYLFYFAGWPLIGTPKSVSLSYFVITMSVRFLSFDFTSQVILWISPT